MADKEIELKIALKRTVNDLPDVAEDLAKINQRIKENTEELRRQKFAREENADVVAVIESNYAEWIATLEREKFSLEEVNHIFSRFEEQLERAEGQIDEATESLGKNVKSLDLYKEKLELVRQTEEANSMQTVELYEKIQQLEMGVRSAEAEVTRMQRRYGLVANELFDFVEAVDTTGHAVEFTEDVLERGSIAVSDFMDAFNDAGREVKLIEHVMEKGAVTVDGFVDEFRQAVEPIRMVEGEIEGIGNSLEGLDNVLSPVNHKLDVFREGVQKGDADIERGAKTLQSFSNEIDDVGVSLRDVPPALVRVESSVYELAQKYEGLKERVGVLQQEWRDEYDVLVRLEGQLGKNSTAYRVQEDRLREVGAELNAVSQEFREAEKASSRFNAEANTLDGGFLGLDELAEDVDKVGGKLDQTKVDLEEFEDKIKKVGRAADGGGNDIREFGDDMDKARKDGEGFARQLQDTFDIFNEGVDFVRNLADVAEKAYEVVFRGAQVQDTASAFEFLVKSGGATVGVLDEMVEASNRTITTFDLQTTASRLLAGAGAEVRDEFAEALPSLVGIADSIATLLPGLYTGSQAFEELAEGVRTYDDEGLQLLGLNTDIEGAIKRAAAALGVEVEQLSASERARIALNEVQRAGLDLMAEVDGSVSNATDTWERLSVRVEENTDRLKTGLEQAWRPYARLLNGELKEAQEANISRLAEEGLAVGATSQQISDYVNDNVWASYLQQMSDFLNGVESMSEHSLNPMILVAAGSTEAKNRHTETMDELVRVTATQLALMSGSAVEFSGRFRASMGTIGASFTESEIFAMYDDLLEKQRQATWEQDNFVRGMNAGTSPLAKQEEAVWGLGAGYEGLAGSMSDVATYVSALDGDTFKFDVDGEVKTVRVAGIDTAESDMDDLLRSQLGIPLAGEAMAFANDLLIDGEVTFGEQIADSYGREVREVFVNGERLAALLAEQGFAFPLNIDLDDADAIAEIEAAMGRAAEAGRGVFENAEIAEAYLNGDIDGWEGVVAYIETAMARAARRAEIAFDPDLRGLFAELDEQTAIFEGSAGEWVQVATDNSGEIAALYATAQEKMGEAAEKASDRRVGIEERGTERVGREYERRSERLQGINERLQADLSEEQEAGLKAQLENLEENSPAYLEVWRQLQGDLSDTQRSNLLVQKQDAETALREMSGIRVEYTDRELIELEKLRVGTGGVYDNLSKRDQERLAELEASNGVLRDVYTGDWQARQDAAAEIARIELEIQGYARATADETIIQRARASGADLGYVLNLEVAFGRMTQARADYLLDLANVTEATEEAGIEALELGLTAEQVSRRMGTASGNFLPYGYGLYEIELQTKLTRQGLVDLEPAIETGAQVAETSASFWLPYRDGLADIYGAGTNVVGILGDMEGPLAGAAGSATANAGGFDPLIARLDLAQSGAGMLAGKLGLLDGMATYSSHTHTTNYTENGTPPSSGAGGASPGNQVPDDAGMAEGGWVRGGVAGRDSVPKLLMPGELVVPVGATRDMESLLGFAHGQGVASGGMGGGVGMSAGFSDGDARFEERGAVYHFNVPDRATALTVVQVMENERRSRRRKGVRGRL